MSRSPSAIVEYLSKVKILFYHASNPFGNTYTWLYPTVLHLKTYVDIMYPDVANKVHWHVPLQEIVSDEDLIQYLHKHQIDILCTGHYLWNHKDLCEQLARVKSKLPSNMKIIAGGPSIDVHTDGNFFNKYSFIDFAVYGPGEQAFADILSHLILDKPLIAFNTSNCGWINKKSGKLSLANYSYVKMLEVSPFVHNQQLFTDMVTQFKNRANWLGDNFWLPYTLTRGCPYSCTFCDWNSGLGNKVSRRKYTFQHDIDLFLKLGATNIYLSDANVGQYDEDVEMIEYFANKNLQENARFHVGGNFSKLKKDNNLKIFHTMIKGSLVKKTINFSVQDINENVLKLIDRPDVGWDVHSAMAKELQTAYPDIVIKAQFIFGLPGQTVESWTDTMQSAVEKRIYPIVFFNEPLPNSPALLDPEYQKKFKFEYVETNRCMPGRIYKSLVPKQSFSFTQSDLVHMLLLSGIFQALAAIQILDQHFEIDFQSFRQNLQHDQTYVKYHKDMLENWQQNNNLYVTNEKISNTNDIYDFIGEVNFVNECLSAPWFGKLVLLHLPSHQQYDFMKSFLRKKYFDWLRDFFQDVD